jgi:hypothetical protein
MTLKDMKTIMNKGISKINMFYTHLFLVIALLFISLLEWPYVVCVFVILPFVFRYTISLDNEIKKSDLIQSLSEKRIKQDLINDL